MQHVDEGTLHAYLDACERPGAGALDPERRLSIERHLAHCATCALALESAERVRARAGDVLLDAAPPLPELPAFPSPASPAARRPRPAWVSLAWAASILVAAGAGWLGSGLWRAEPRPLGSSESAAAAPAATSMDQSPPAAAPPDAVASSVDAQAATVPVEARVATGGGLAAADVAAPRDDSAAVPQLPEVVVASTAPVAAAPPPPVVARVTPAVEDAGVASEKGRQARQFVAPPAAAVQLEALVVTGMPHSYPGDAAVVWTEVSLAEAQRLLADTLLLVPGAAIERIASDSAGRVLLRQREAAGVIELVQWRTPRAHPAVDATRALGYAADGLEFAVVERGGSTVAIKAAPGRVESLVQRLARRP